MPTVSTSKIFELSFKKSQKFIAYYQLVVNFHAKI